MAFDQKDLHAIAQAGANSVFFYATADAAVTVEGAAYITAPDRNIKVGDVIIASMVTGGTGVLKIYTVDSIVAATGVAVLVSST